MTEHTHLTRYTLYTQPHQWWKRLFGIVERQVFTGVRSSQLGGELLIFRDDGFVSINYARVLRMEAEPLEAHPHAQEASEPLPGLPVITMSQAQKQARQAARTVVGELRARGEWVEA